ncbi:MAG: hypothetical protein ACHQPI_05115, partial [Thermoanaerobaculia bacterium]
MPSTSKSDIAPIAEQHKIVRCVEVLFKFADVIEKRVAAVTARAEKLTQAILERASAASWFRPWPTWRGSRGGSTRRWRRCWSGSEVRARGLTRRVPAAAGGPPPG